MRILVLFLIILSCAKEKTQSEAVTFKLDFSKQKNYIYSYVQTSNSETQFGKDRPPNKAKINANGNLNIRVKENNLADVSFTNLETSLISYNQNESKGDTITNTAPPMVVQNMTEKGMFSDGNHNFAFDVMFPLPSKNLKLGEEEKLAMRIPFNANGSRLFVSGFTTLKYVKNDRLDGQDCAVLEGVVNIANLETPEELDTYYESSTTGNATYYFSLDKQYFIGTDIKLNMRTTSKIKDDDSNEASFDSSMKNNTTMKIRLQTIED